MALPGTGTQDAGRGRTPPHAHTGGGYLPYVDGLRAIAVLAVIAYHLDPAWLPGGFVGVDMFFVISGFVVSASLQRLPAAGQPGVFAQFYARRMRRIAPALVACLLVTALASGLFIPESWLSETSAKTGRMAFVGLSNWVLAATGNDYFSPKAEFNPYTHTWSLGVEEQFYLLFPLLFLAWNRGGRGRLWSTLLVALASAASLAFAWLRSRDAGDAAAAFYLTTARFWQLGSGVLLYQVLALCGRFDAGTQAPPPGAWRWRSPLLAVALGAIAFGLWSARPGHSPWPDGLWPVVGTLGLLALLHGAPAGWTRRALAHRVPVAIGRLSYSLYLWHWPVFVLLRWTVGLESAATRVAALLLVAALALASYRWVERPWRHGRIGRARTPVRTIAAGVGLVLLAAGMQALLQDTQRYYGLSTVSRHPLDWYAYAKGLRREFPQCTLQTRQVPVQVGSAKLFERGACTLHNRDGGQLFVAGDSHALAYNELLRRFSLQSGVPVRLYGVGGCPIIGLQAWQAGNPGCQAYERSALADVAAHARSGDVLFLPALRVLRLADQDRLFDETAVMAEQEGAAAQAARSAGETAAVALLQPLAQRGVRIVFEAPKPVLRAPPYRCSDWFNRGNPICAHGIPIPRATMERYRAPVLQSLQRIAAQLPHASVWDPLPLLCDAQQCTGFGDGRPLFFDADHLSGYGNRVLLPGFTSHFAAIQANSPPVP
ncbi:MULTISPECIES: acyltransferase family protein [Xanthomonas]|uniref:acyltransferase family protein n=1 Tax=Xanthomonas TaxID=338 RepID=UPI001ADB54FE|nr:acyltransferase family protein [Xanthomonas sp. A6251]MBO9874238.1 acyltransferase [Xanthomonas sp. D-93]WNH46614.1 acyltransferase family protein [Xanthomonas sp. A6251]